MDQSLRNVLWTIIIFGTLILIGLISALIGNLKKELLEKYPTKKIKSYSIKFYLGY